MELKQDDRAKEESDTRCSIAKMPQKTISIDEAFELAGGMGVYQWMVFLLVGIVAVFSAESVNVNFIGGTQEHWCYVPELYNFSFNEQKFIAIPSDDDSEYSECEMFNLNYSQYSHHDFLHWNRSLVESAPRTECPHGWMYDQSQYVETVTSRVSHLLPEYQLRSSCQVISVFHGSCWRLGLL